MILRHSERSEESPELAHLGSCRFLAWLVGSTNLDYRSIEYKLELSAVVRSSRFGQQMNRLFADDVKYATRISLSEWRKRPLSDRFGSGR